VFVLEDLNLSWEVVFANKEDICLRNNVYNVHFGVQNAMVKDLIVHHFQ